MILLLLTILIPIANVRDLSRACDSGSKPNSGFNLIATSISRVRPGDPSINVTDGGGAVRILLPHGATESFLAGDRLHLKGQLEKNDYDQLTYAVATNLVLVGHGERPQPIEATPALIYSGKVTDALVRIHGTVVDAFRDEVDPRFTFLALSTQGETIYCPSVLLTDEDLRTLIDAKISVIGKCCSYHDIGPRAKLGYEVYVDDMSDITILEAAPQDPFDVPILEGTVREICLPRTDGILRRKICGTVAAVANHRRIFVRTSEKEMSTILLAGDERPRVGERIEVVGLPETDFYHRNLSRAIYRIQEGPLFKDPPVKVKTAKQLLMDSEGNRRFDILQHGAVIRLTGTLSDWTPQKTFLLKSGEFLIPIDYSSLPNLPNGLVLNSKIEVTGLCVMETENWRPQNPFPHVTKMSLILRTENDLRILARPPWWTVGRILATLGGIIAVVFLLLAYRLIRERLGRIRSQLKAEERTRLAVELHDSLAQNLTGISLEIDTALKLDAAHDPSAQTHLSIASQALKSCRDELRNCLWDLRNHALEEPTMDAAIRQTLAPYLTAQEVAAKIRFAVPRTKLSENRVHTLLRIIRELSVNAIRHGKATKLYIAGSTEDEKLLFSVRDNGCGFDPKSAPGIQEGHYGLLGIQERIDEFEGEFKLESEPGKGTKAIVEIKL